MVVKASNQTKREFCVAIFNRELHKNSICPANHDVEYGHSWFYFDGHPQQRPELTAEVDEIMASGSHYVGYWRGANTYVLVPNNEFTDFHDDDQGY